jgi:DNA-binding IclR family transcriptional regulator
MAFRAKSESRALAELLYLVARYPGYPVMVTDNILGRSMAPSKVNKMLNSMIRLGLMTRDNDSVLSLAVRADAGVRVS